MATLHRGFKAGAGPIQRKYLVRSDTELATDALPGVTVHVLGPSKDEEVIRDMNPQPRRASSGRPPGSRPPIQNDLLPFPETAALDGQPNEMVKEFLRKIAHQSALLGAVTLESAVNNTSLMLVFEVGEAVLLFPGDSQWGSWKINLEDPLRKELLKRTTFYKIGHHGSHNVTPVTFINNVINRPGGPASEVWAAASVTPHSRFTEIPKLALLKELTERIGEPKRVVRSDEPPSASSAPDGLSVIRKNRKAIRLDFELPVNGG